ncbi:hypothetical protein GCM10009716_41590 [Streptomyces sodiiphilus]|uniref:SF4 helicase domain-containing protein n=1 Tax=Streptomyces sodiiphilus TaxID=226217 RepID=A0ABN2PRR4_9ACTN
MSDEGVQPTSPTPSTMHQARKMLPQLVKAAHEGRYTPLTRHNEGREYQALLVSPQAAEEAGWDLTAAAPWPTAQARKKLGDLIQQAAQGHPQVLRRHTTPVAVLLPANPDGTLRTPAEPTATTAEPPSTAVPSRSDATAPPTPSTAPQAVPPPGTTATTATTPPAAPEPPATVPAAPHTPRRLAPLSQALTTILPPATGAESEPAPHETALGGLSTGIPSLDAALGGLHPGRFYLVAAAPGAGGSLIAAGAARAVALDHHRPVLYAASGLTSTDVAARIVAAHLPVDYRRLRASRLTPTEQADVTALHQELAAAPLYIDDDTDLTTTAIAETAADVPGLALVVVDRLQATDDPRLPLSGPRLTDAAQALAHLARTHHLPVLAALDTDTPDLIATLGLDITLTLTRDTDQAHLTLTERDLGTQDTLTLHADLAHARLTDPINPNASLREFTSDELAALRPQGRSAPEGPAGASDVPPSEPEPGTISGPSEAPTDWPAVAVPEGGGPTGTPSVPSGRPSGPSGPASAGSVGPAPGSQSSPGSAAATGGAVSVGGSSSASAGAGVLPVGGGVLAGVSGPVVGSGPGASQAASRTVPEVSAAAPPAVRAGGADAGASRLSASASSGGGRASGGYAGRDYSYFTGMITRAVDQALEEYGGDVDAATQALVLKASPNAMELFEATRVGGNYEHTVYPELMEFLRKKNKDGVDEIWEGRHNWTNTALLDQLHAGKAPAVTVDALDTNASYLSAFKTYLPIGALVHQGAGGFDPKRSGIYQLPTRPVWSRPDLPDPIGNRREEGPVLLDDATVRLLFRCARYGLCEVPVISECWTSGASEGLLEKFRRVLTEARETAIRNQDTVTVEYIKAMYSKFVSTMGESTTNRDIRRPEWMHIIRSQAFANLWHKAYKAHQHGLTIVRVRGTDELHVTGGEWRKVPGREGGVFEEGRLTTHMKLKNRYTLPRKPTA